MDTIRIDMGLEITKEREKRGFSLREAAKIFNVAHTTLGKWETGETKLPAKAYEAFRILWGLDLSPFLIMQLEREGLSSSNHLSKFLSAEMTETKEPSSVKEAIEKAKKFLIAGVRDTSLLKKTYLLAEWGKSNSKNTEDKVECLHLLSLICMKMGKPDWASDYINEALLFKGVSPTLRMNLWVNEAVCRGILEEVEFGIAAAERAYNIYKELEDKGEFEVLPEAFVWLHYAKAYCLSLNGMFNEALRLVNIATSSAKNSGKSELYDYFSALEGYLEIELNRFNARECKLADYKENVGWTKLQRLKNVDDLETRGVAALYLAKVAIKFSKELSASPSPYIQILLDCSEKLEEIRFAAEALFSHIQVQKKELNESCSEKQLKNFMLLYKIFTRLSSIPKRNKRLWKLNHQISGEVDHE